MFLNSQCFFGELTDDLLSICQPFSCGNEDLDDFFRNDATRYAYYLMGKSYCFRKTDDPTKIVCTFTVSNDSIRIYDLPRSRKDYMKSLTHHEKPLRRYPGVLIGRLGVNKDLLSCDMNQPLIKSITSLPIPFPQKSGCRFVIVDAINAPEVISFYQKNGFQPLFSSEEQEFLYTGGKKGQPIKMATRLMYFDLLWMRQ